MNTDNTDKNPEQSNSGNFKFALKTITIMIVVITLGLFFIKNMFDESKEFKKLDLSGSVGKFAALADSPISDNLLIIYFTTDGRTLTPETRESIQRLPSTEKARLILNELINGPKQGYVKSTISKQTKIRGIYLLKDELVVDFSEDIVKECVDGFTPELLAVYSVVNSILMNCKEITRVKILVEGQPRDVFKNYIEISGALTENAAIAEWQ